MQTLVHYLDITLNISVNFLPHNRSVATLKTLLNAMILAIVALIVVEKIYYENKGSPWVHLVFALHYPSSCG